MSRVSIEHKLAYREYLRSDKWQNVRLEALVREKGMCQICGLESISNDAHHVWYPESVWDTTEAHLVVLCRGCHDFLHTMLPECKTKDEEKGRQEWLKFFYAIKAWRAAHASLYRPKESPKELRAELDRLHEVIAKYECGAGAPRPDVTPKDQTKAILRTIKKWADAYLESADSVKSEVADTVS